MPMIERLKERKPAILEQLSNGLNAVFASVPFTDIFEDISVGVNHKNPQVRGQIVKLLSRRLKEIKVAPGKSEYKALSEMMLKTLDDADGNTREAGAEGLGTLMKVVGEKALSPYLEGLDDIKMGKIKEACEKAEVKAKAAPVKKPAPPPAKKVRKILKSLFIETDQADQDCSLQLPSLPQRNHHSHRHHNQTLWMKTWHPLPLSVLQNVSLLQS